ncbi:MAG: hypothetical protein ACOC40_03095 [Thermoplasmatota archaeon]
MKSKVLCDTDIISALAKAEALDILELIFPKHEFLITEYVRDELDRSKQEGFDFPHKIFDFCKTITLNEDELEIYESLEYVDISKTDLKNLIITKNRNMPLLTNDSKLYYKCEERDINVYDLRQILKAVFVDNLLSKNDLMEIVSKIEEKDNTTIKNKSDLFRRQ